MESTSNNSLISFPTKHIQDELCGWNKKQENDKLHERIGARIEKVYKACKAKARRIERALSSSLEILCGFILRNGSLIKKKSKLMYKEDRLFKF